MVDIAHSDAMSIRGRTAAADRLSGFDLFWRGVAIPAALLLAWIIVARLGLVSNNLLVPLDQVLVLPFADQDGRELWPALGASIVRLALGFLLGAVAGLGLGLLLGMSRTAEGSVGPCFNALRQIAPFAWIPLLTAWFGNGDLAKVVFISLSSFFPVALNTHEGLRNIPVPYFEVARVLRLSARQRVTRLLLPAALPSIFVGVQVGLITAWIGTVGAEYAMGIDRGIGTFISGGREQFRMDIVLLGVLTLALVGYALNVACSRLFRNLLRWQGP